MKPLLLLLSLALLAAASPLLPAADKPESQIHIAAKFIETEAKLFKRADILSESQFQSQLRKLNDTGGIDILSAPSVIARNNQEARIEVIREFPFPARHKDDKVEFDNINVGVTLDLDPVLEGDRIVLVGKAVVREIDDIEPRKKFFFLKSKEKPVQSVTRKQDQSLTTTSFNTSETVFDASLKNGHTLLIPCRQSDKFNGQLIIALTAQKLDPAGKPVAGTTK